MTPKERPILFNAEMVQAILGGRKTQTRRVIKPGCTYDEKAGFKVNGFCYGIGIDFEETKRNLIKCLFKYGKVGDRLWVRETWRTDKKLDNSSPKKFSRWPVQYLADNFVNPCGSFFGEVDGKKRASIHMPRWASRIDLEITNVRIERLNDISEEDAKAEGYPHSLDGEFLSYFPNDWYRDLWESINGIGSWELNPWVWVIDFKRVKQIIYRESHYVTSRANYRAG